MLITENWLGFVRRRQLVFSMVLFWVVFHRRKVSAWGGLLSNERVRGFPSLLLNAKCICCYLNYLAFFFFLWVVILGRRFVLSKMEKKSSFHQGLDYKVADYKAWYLSGSSYGVLCWGDLPRGVCEMLLIFTSLCDSWRVLHVQL